MGTLEFCNAQVGMWLVMRRAQVSNVKEPDNHCHDSVPKTELGDIVLENRN